MGNIFDKFSLKERVSLITGGERGIGLEIGKAFAQAGSHIIIAGLDEESSAKAMQEIKAEGVKCVFLKTDVTAEDQVIAAVEKAVKDFGSIDVLVNNAGISKGAKAEEMSLDSWNRVMDINLTGTFLFSREAAKQTMLKQGKGSIINISSMSGIISNNPQEQSNYNASKSGVIMLTKSMAGEWAARGVRVNSIAPGYMRTPLTEHRFKDAENPVIKRWLSMTPMGRVGTPDELAGIALYFATDASSFTTGVTIAVDGGYTCW